MMVKTPRKPTKQETAQLITLLLKQDLTGFETREDIADEVSAACIAVFEVDKKQPEDDIKEMVVMWPRNLEVTKAFFWEHGKLYEERINP